MSKKTKRSSRSRMAERRANSRFIQMRRSSHEGQLRDHRRALHQAMLEAGVIK